MGAFGQEQYDWGGMIIKTDEESEKTNVQSNQRRKGIDTNLGMGPLETVSGISQNNGRLNQNSSSNAEEKITVVGGDVTYMHPNDNDTRR